MSYATRKEVAFKVEWEGGVNEALEYGLTVEDMPEGDTELRAAWGTLIAVHDVLQPLTAVVEELLSAEPQPDYRAEVDRVKTDAQVKLDAHRDEIDRLRAALRHIRDSEHYAGGEAETLRRLQHLAGATLGGPKPDYRALLVRAVRELAGSGVPGQNDVAAELARDGGIEL